MKTEIKNINSEDLKQLIQDVALIKEILSINKQDSEGELSNWAKKELKEARKTQEKISHEEVTCKTLMR